MIKTHNPRMEGLHLLTAEEVAEYLDLTEIQVLRYYGLPDLSVDLSL